MDIDSQQNNYHNKSSNDTNEKHEVVDLTKKEPITVKNCEHKFVLDGEEIGDRVAWKCTNCRRGVFLRKDQQIT